MLNKVFLIKKLSQTILHIIFWIGVLFFYTYFFGVGSDNMNYILAFSLFLMPITIATTYVSIYKLIPDYLIKKRYFYFGLYSIYTLIISMYLIVLSVFFGLIYLSHFKLGDMAPISQSVLFVMVGVYLVTILISAFKLLKLNLKNTTKTSTLEKKILEAQLKLKEQELKYLKMQVHPHFLFNTLNTMYGFALKKADETPEMILKLSNLLDYLLYQIDKPFVNLEDEINHIKDYIALEELRFNDRLNVNLIENHKSEHSKITPMVLLPFVENSFKHGQLENGELNIEIRISSHKNRIEFNIKNKAELVDSNQQGIGLENIKKRLELLYNNNYKLHIATKNNLFEVDLVLNSIANV